MLLDQLLRFDLGESVITPGARAHLAAVGIAESDIIARHARGDWGAVCPDDAAENEFSIIHGFRILSRYDLGGDSLYVITEADRSRTTILLTHEY